MLVRDASSFAAAPSNMITVEVMVINEAEINKSNDDMSFMQAFRDASAAVAGMRGYHCLCNVDWESCTLSADTGAFSPKTATGNDVRKIAVTFLNSLL